MNIFNFWVFFVLLVFLKVNQMVPGKTISPPWGAGATGRVSGNSWIRGEGLPVDLCKKSMILISPPPLQHCGAILQGKKHIHTPTCISVSIYIMNAHVQSRLWNHVSKYNTFKFLFFFFSFCMVPEAEYPRPQFQ